MAIRNIILEGDPMLRKKSKPVREVNDHIRETMQDMVETMRQHDGVGLAAPQVGVMRRMFVAEPMPDEVYYMINPEILEQDGSQTGEEGCLSVPDLEGVVERPQHIKIRALDLDGNEQNLDFEDFHARVMCHEYDHLEGVLYIDKATETYDPQERYEELQREYEEKNAELRKKLDEVGAESEAEEEPVAKQEKAAENEKEPAAE
ncbi:MAG: peptide deformylase [Eubacterium sp.]|nr:peptide deformylase [Eubacterium sp.]